MVARLRCCRDGVITPCHEPRRPGVTRQSTLNRLEQGLIDGASRYCKIGLDDRALEQV